MLCFRRMQADLSDINLFGGFLREVDRQWCFIGDTGRNTAKAEAKLEKALEYLVPASRSMTPRPNPTNGSLTLQSSLP